MRKAGEGDLALMVLAWGTASQPDRTPSSIFRGSSRPPGPPVACRRCLCHLGSLRYWPHGLHWRYNNAVHAGAVQ
jgi:hypothetical protein